MSTIFDVAREARVSITTVSRALNGYSDVSQKTRERVVDIAQKLNYYPSAAARSLQGKKTNTIAFAPMLRQHVESEPFFKEFLGVLALACFKHNLSLLASGVDSPTDTNEIYRELAGTGRVDGIILADIKPQDERIALMQSIGLPFVAFGRTNDFGRLHYPLVDVDGAAGIHSVVDYLYKRGHRRIAYLSGPMNTSYALYRYSGYKEALRKRDLEQDPVLVKDELQEVLETAQAVYNLLRLPRTHRPSAIVASNDQLALQVMNALEANGLQVSCDLGEKSMAVTGFDDLPFAAYIQPALTTVRQPMQAICDALLHLLVALIEGKDAATLPENERGLSWIGPQQMLVAPLLVPRSSA